MIGTIKPLVQEAKHPGKYLSILSLYSMGSLISSSILGATLGALLLPGTWSLWAMLLIAIAGLLMSLCDFGVAGLHTCTLGRQTTPLWWYTLGPMRAVLLWDIDLGLGFTTIRVASLYWIVMLMVIVQSSPLIGATILGAYGLALAFNLGVGLLILGHGEHITPPSILAIRLLYPFKTSLAVILFVWSTWLVIITVQRF